MAEEITVHITEEEMALLGPIAERRHMRVQELVALLLSCAIDELVDGAVGVGE